MVLILWRVDQQDGYVFDSEVLDRHTNIKFHVTVGGKNANLSMSGPTPLTMQKMIQFLETCADRDKGLTREDLSWDFASKTHFQERCSIHLYKTNVDDTAEFPTTQQQSYDVIGKQGRLQFKTARRDRNNFRVNMRRKSGSTNGKPQWCPYAKGDFDMLVVYHIDWKINIAHMWTFPSMCCKCATSSK